MFNSPSDNTLEPDLLTERQMNVGRPDVCLSQDEQSLNWELPGSKPEDAAASDSWLPLEPPDTSGALEAVARIVRREDDPDTVIARRVLRVAEWYGPLYLCGHGRPMNHAADGTPEELHRQCLLDISMSERGSERISHWRIFALEIRNLITFAGSVSVARNFGDVREEPDGQQVERYWGGNFMRTVPRGWEIGPAPASPHDRTQGYQVAVELPDAHTWIEMRTRALIEEARIMPTVAWNPSKSRFDFGFDPGALGLFGVVVIQLALRIGGAERWLVCDGCQIAYNRPRTRKMPGPTQLNFCDECTVDEPIKRQAQRAMNRRKTDGQQA